MRIVIRWGVMISLFLLCAVPALGKYRPGPSEYGRVVLDNFSRNAGMAPVVFDHWHHRTMFTCRVCHIDVGFAMSGGATGIKASDNMAGLYCGTCHNGKMMRGSKKVFAACTQKAGPEDTQRCNKCHSYGLQVKKDYDFALVTEKFPKDKFGNMIDWDKAEEEGYIKPMDFLEGVSSKRVKAKPQQDFSLKSKSTWMSDIKFSHKKHLTWLGCETCHPEIFNIKKGSTQYTMLEVYSGKYCGVCHNSVAFPLRDCQRCHTKPV